jgi:bla regulator protein blaR1
MAPLCILYFLVVGAWLGAAALMAERALPATMARRWIWCVSIVASIALPMILSARHSSHVIGLWGHELLRIPAAPAVGTEAESLRRQLLDCAAGYGTVIRQLWFAAALLVLAWGLLSAWRLRRLIRAQGVTSPERTVVDGVPATLTSSLGPATVGFWRPRVLLPRWVLALPPARRRYVVRHEDEHRRAHDPALLALLSALVALMPWNVALWWQLRRLRLAVEMDCDRRVVASLGDAVGYGELLLDVAEASSRGPRLQPALLGGSGMLERRLGALVGGRDRGILEWVVAPVAAVALVAVVLSVPHPEMAADGTGRRVAAVATQDGPSPESPRAAPGSARPHH